MALRVDRVNLQIVLEEQRKGDMDKTSPPNSREISSLTSAFLFPISKQVSDCLFGVFCCGSVKNVLKTDFFEK